MAFNSDQPRDDHGMWSAESANSASEKANDSSSKANLSGSAVDHSNAAIAHNTAAKAQQYVAENNKTQDSTNAFFKAQASNTAATYHSNAGSSKANEDSKVANQVDSKGSEAVDEKE